MVGNQIRGRASLLAGMFAVTGLLGTACSDIDTGTAMAEVVEVRAQQVQTDSAAGDAATETTNDGSATDGAMADVSDTATAAEVTPGLSDGSAEAEQSPSVLPSAEPVEEISTAPEQTETNDDEPGDGTVNGESAMVPVGSWTVQESDVGVRVRETPAGEIMGFIIRGDIARTTGEARVYRDVSWAQVELRDGTIGWMAIDLLEGVADEDLPENNRPDDDGETETASAGENANDADPNVDGDDDDADDDADPNEGDDDADDAAEDDDADDDNGAAAAAAALADDDLSPIQVQPQAAFVSTRTDATNIYSEPRLDSQPVRSIATGDELVITQAQGWRNGDVPFVLVRFEDAEGWVDGRYLDVRGNN